MRLQIFLLFVFANISAVQAAVPAGIDRQEETISFQYTTEIPAVSHGEGPVHFFVPIAVNDEHQEILERKIESSVKGEIRTEPKYGNTFWSVSLPDTHGKPIPVTVSYLVKRKRFAGLEQTRLPATAPEKELAQYLQPNRLVPTSGSLIDQIRKDLPESGQTAEERARAIFDYVVDNMEYKKVGRGWGNGDTHWACTKKFGNCTDFHALFISLARAENIPARFEIGFPIPEDANEGIVGGYHCWVTFYLEGKGWVPIDASEAKKHPEKRALLFGTQPPDRIFFSRGRDIELGEGHETRPLNYFIYPHVEVAGKVRSEIPTQFTYRVLS
ncbi:MAG: transglutaminase domain-containing protein [Bdellovibrionales bacterium]|nr:transglutaminase domain-containing protein [Bdellovibrionales bacterium]